MFPSLGEGGGADQRLEGGVATVDDAGQGGTSGAGWLFGPSFGPETN